MPAELSAIDQALMRNVVGEWRKIARVVGAAMGENAGVVSGVPDIYYAQRLRRMIEVGTIESQGDIGAMGLGEVRRVPRSGNAI